MWRRGFGVHTENADLSAAVATAVNALQAGGTNVEPRTVTASTLEIVVLDSNRPRRAFRRITGSALETLLPQSDPPAEETKTAAE